MGFYNLMQLTMIKCIKVIKNLKLTGILNKKKAALLKIA